MKLLVSRVAWLFTSRQRVLEHRDNERSRCRVPENRGSACIVVNHVSSRRSTSTEHGRVCPPRVIRSLSTSTLHTEHALRTVQCRARDKSVCTVRCAEMTNPHSVTFDLAKLASAASIFDRSNSGRGSSMDHRPESLVCRKRSMRAYEPLISNSISPLSCSGHMQQKLSFNITHRSVVDICKVFDRVSYIGHKHTDDIVSWLLREPMLRYSVAFAKACLALSESIEVLLSWCWCRNDLLMNVLVFT